jgi:hypothetical protein
MTDDIEEVECVALELIARFGKSAARIARGLAAVTDRPVYFVLCAPFNMPLVFTWPLTDCSKRCLMQCGYANSDIHETEQKIFKPFELDANYVSCKLLEIVKEHQHDPQSSQTWRAIADTIERLSLKP